MVQCQNDHGWLRVRPRQSSYTGTGSRCSMKHAFLYGFGHKIPLFIVHCSWCWVVAPNRCDRHLRPTAACIFTLLLVFDSMRAIFAGKAVVWLNVAVGTRSRSWRWCWRRWRWRRRRRGRGGWLRRGDNRELCISCNTTLVRPVTSHPDVAFHTPTGRPGVLHEPVPMPIGSAIPTERLAFIRITEVECVSAIERARIRRMQCLGLFISQRASTRSN